MKRMNVDISKCTACNTCELACAFVNSGTVNGPRRSRVQVTKTGKDKGIPLLCLECEDAACIKVCPTDALFRSSAFEMVDIDHEKCINCKMCVVACPFGNIIYDEPKNEISKCDLCHGQPMCAMFCPTGALQYK